MYRPSQRAFLAIALLIGVGCGVVACNVVADAFLTGTTQALQNFLNGGTGGSGGVGGTGGDAVTTAFVFANFSDEQFVGSAEFEQGTLGAPMPLAVGPDQFVPLAQVCVGSIRVSGATETLGSIDITLVRDRDYQCGQGVVLNLGPTGDPVLQIFNSPAEITLGLGSAPPAAP